MISSPPFPGWANIYLWPTTLGTISMVITFGFAGGFTGATSPRAGTRSGQCPADSRA